MEKMRQWMVLTALGVVGVLAAGWFLAVSPQRSHANELRTQASTVEQSTAGLRTQVEQLKQQQKGETAQQRKLEQIATQIPDNPQLPTLIRQLSAAAKEAGVSLVSLAPSAPSMVTGTAGAAAASPLAQIPITIDVTGTYFNIESFFRNLEHLDRALMATGWQLGGDAGADSGSGATGTAAASPDAIRGQIQAVVFESPAVLPPPAATPSAAQAPAATAPSTAASTAPSTSTTTPAQPAGSEQ